MNLIDYYDTLPQEAKTRYFGMDVGSTSDRTAIVTLSKVKDTLFLEDIVIMHKASYQNQLDILRELHKKHNY